MRRWFVHAVALALLLPSLVAVMPQPALSAAAALDRDLLISVCGQDGPQQQDHVPHQAAHEHCVLCASHGPGCSPSLAGASPAFAPAPRQGGLPPAAAADAAAPPLQALLVASPPRGPPAAV